MIKLTRNLPVIEIDREIVKLYNEFHDLPGNAELLRKEPLKYWHEAREYREPRLRKFIYNRR